MSDTTTGTPVSPRPLGRGARLATAGRQTLEVALRIGGLFVAIGIVWGIFSCAFGFGLSLVHERTRGTLVRLRIAPISRGKILAAKATACLVAIVGIATLLRGIAADTVLSGGGGADINPSVREARIPSLALAVDDSKYFLIHHTPADTVDKIDPGEMARCAAAVAVMTYVVADLPDRLE